MAAFFFDELLRHGVTTALTFATSHPASVDAAFEEARARIGEDRFIDIDYREVAREAQDANLDFDVRGNDQQAHIERLQASTPGGSLELKGSAAWAPKAAMASRLARARRLKVIAGSPGWVASVVASK